MVYLQNLAHNLIHCKALLRSGPVPRRHLKISHMQRHLFWSTSAAAALWNSVCGSVGVNIQLTVCWAPVFLVLHPCLLEWWSREVKVPATRSSVVHSFSCSYWLLSCDDAVDWWYIYYIYLIYSSIKLQYLYLVIHKIVYMSEETG